MELCVKHLSIQQKASVKLTEAFGLEILSISLKSTQVDIVLVACPQDLFKR